MALNNQLAAAEHVVSEFGAKSTAADVAAGHDLSGKTVLITGGYGGIGLETTRALADAGARVIVAGRRKEAGQQALAAAEIADSVSVVQLDLADLADVAAVVRSLEQVHLDYLITNAGVFLPSLRHTPAGWEEQFAVNHLGHFALVAGVYRNVRPGGRIVVVSSASHIASDIHWDDIDNRVRPFDPGVAYGQSKTANALHAVALDELAATTGVHAYAVHPGFVPGTDLTPPQHDTESQWAKSNPQGAATTVWAVTAPELQPYGGVYLKDCAVATVDHSTTAPETLADYQNAGVRPYALDVESALRLRMLSAERTGVDLP